MYCITVLHFKIYDWIRSSVPNRFGSLSTLCIRNGNDELWTFRSQDHSLPGAKVPGVELSLPGTFQANGGWSESTQPGAKVDDMLSRFHLIPERYGQTDGRTDRFTISISCVSMLMRDKNQTTTQFTMKIRIKYNISIN